jgi:hypothetical protein
MHPVHSQYNLSAPRRVQEIYAKAKAWVNARLAVTSRQQAQFTPAHAASPGLFAQVMLDASNLETEWLWLYTRVTHDYERRYCLERILHVNSANTFAIDELARLDAEGVTLPMVVMAKS